MLDHLTGALRVRHRRGAGSHEIATFNIHDRTTRSEWDEVIPEIVRMWEQEDYTSCGQALRHGQAPQRAAEAAWPPAIWVACGARRRSPSGPARDRGARLQLLAGVAMRLLIDSYKEGIASCEEPIGEFLNDNVMITNSVVCMEDRDRAREIVTRYGRGYLYSLVCLYHDTIPVPPNAPGSPSPRTSSAPSCSTGPSRRGTCCAGPRRGVRADRLGVSDGGVDQLVFGVPGGAVSHEETLEILEVFKQVIPEFDKDPVHSTTRYRESATPKHPTFNAPPPELGSIWSEGAYRGVMTLIEERPVAVHIGADDLPWVDIGDGSKLKVLQVKATEGLWIVQNIFQAGYTVPTHRHTGPVWGLHDLRRLALQGVRLRQPGGVVPLRAGRLRPHPGVHRGRHQRVVPDVRRQPQPRRRGQHRERLRRPRHPGRLLRPVRGRRPAQAQRRHRVAPPFTGTAFR